MHLIIILLAVVTATVVIVYRTRSPKAPAPGTTAADGRLPEGLRTLAEALEEAGMDTPRCAVVLLGADPALSIERISKALETRFHAEGPVQSIDRVGSLSTVAFARAAFSFELVQPLPETQGEHLVRQSAAWPGAARAISAHRCAVVVRIAPRMGLAGKVDVLEFIKLAATTTQVVNAFLDTCPQSLAFYWPPAGHVLAPREVRRFASGKMRDEDFIHAWVSCTAFRDASGRTIGYTRGLSTLGATEFEALDAPEGPEQLRSRLRALTAYAVLTCRQIQNGDTTGIDDEERIELVRKPSETVHRGWVFQMRYLKASPQDDWR